MTIASGRGTSRSGFLKQAAGAAVVVAGAGAGAGAMAQRAAAGNVVRPIFSLEIEGVDVGLLAGADGGDLAYQVIDDAVSSDHIQHKHLGGLKYEDFTLQVGSGMGKPMSQWIADSFDHGYDPSAARSGAVITLDSKNTETGRRQFSQTFISSVTFPALDGAAKETGYLTVTLSPTTVTDVPPSGLPVKAAKQRAWLCSNFALEVDGVDTTRVASIDSFTWQRLVQPDGSVVLDAGDLSVYFDPASLPSWQQWYDNFAVGGDATDERRGTLELVGQGGTVLDLGLSNLGLYELAPGGGSAIRRVKAEMYCEELTVGSWASP